MVLQIFRSLVGRTPWSLARPCSWFYTGDIARRDEDGSFYIVQRKKDMIVVSGFKVFPTEVEEVLFTQPAVIEAAGIGVPHGYRGEVAKTRRPRPKSCSITAVRGWQNISYPRMWSSRQAFRRAE